MGFNYLTASVSFLLCVTIWHILESPNIEEKKEERNHESVFKMKYMKGIIIGISMMFMQQFSGTNGIFANLADIFRDAVLNLDPNY